MSLRRPSTLFRRALVVLNPVAGQSSPETVRGALEAALAASGRLYRVYETTGDDDLAVVVGQARQEGCDLVVAVGGDGTVAQVADQLVGTGIPLGIIPTGTANVLAVELGIPEDLSGAVALLTGDAALREIDAMQVGCRHYFLQMGVGLDALMIRDTDREAKRRLGKLAYLGTLVGKLFGHRSRRFGLVVDGRRHRARAWQIEIANVGALGPRLFRWGPHIEPDDGVLDLVVVRVRSPLDYLRLAWRLLFSDDRSDPAVRYYRIRRSASITSARRLPVQADGEIIGTTPLRVTLVPKAIRVVVPSVEPTEPTAVEPISTPPTRTS